MSQRWKQRLKTALLLQNLIVTEISFPFKQGNGFSVVPVLELILPGALRKTT